MTSPLSRRGFLAVTGGLLAAGGMTAALPGDSQAPANPPRDLSLALLVRTRPGLRAYGVLGWPDPRVSHPAGITLNLDQDSSGTPAAAAFHVATASDVTVTRIVGDRTTATWSPPGEAPTGCAATRV